MDSEAGDQLQLERTRFVDKESRHNNFNLLRLLFASLVIVSHSPELLDGNRSRELATQVFGTLSFGEIAVEGFFLISGYLITKSFKHSRSTSNFLLKRIVRIVPGFVIAYLVSFFVIGPIVGGHLSQLTLTDFANVFFQLATLGRPETFPGAFEGVHYPELNASMWTISYEFRCYLLVAIFGALGVFQFRWVVLGTALACLALASTSVLSTANTFGTLGSYAMNTRFFSIFLVGSSFYLFQDVLTYSLKYAALAGCVLIALMFKIHFAMAALAVFGGYLILYFALACRATVASRMANRVDISYGLYLYAWPVQNTLVYFFPRLSPWLLLVFALPVSGIFGFLSWHFVESIAMQLNRRYLPM